MADGISICQIIKEAERLIRIQENDGIIPKAAIDMSYLSLLVNHYTLYMCDVRWDHLSFHGEGRRRIISSVKIMDVDGEVFFRWSRSDPDPEWM